MRKATWLVLAAVSASGAAANIHVGEDFEAEPFPPAGWTSYTYHTARTQRETISPPYHYVALNWAGGGDQGFVNFLTPPFDFPAADMRVTFDYAFWDVSYYPGFYEASVRLCDDNRPYYAYVLIQKLEKSTGMKGTRWDFAAPAGRYRVGFVAVGSVESRAYLRVDNVVWESGPFTAVVCTSWGAVKALYY